MASSSHVLAFTDTIVKMNMLNPDLLHATGKGFLGFETGHFFVTFKTRGGDRKRHFEHSVVERVL
jgi:hypothetical protein